ncbi:MAG: cytochrome-c peroxidase [Acidobacteriaceae bacterium]
MKCLAATIFALLLGVSGCSTKALNSDPSTDISPTALRLRFSPIAVPVAQNAAQVNLGRQLYYDPRLSVNNSISCNSCHGLTALYGADDSAFSDGYKGQKGGRNAPTVYNSALEFAQFWDGRAADLAAQAKGPIQNPVEMGMPNGDLVVSRLKGVPEYQKEFKAAFPSSKDPVTFDNVATAIAAFEDGLMTPAPWDKYLEGDTAALTADQKHGLRIFLKTGCAACHAGRDMGGNSYERLGYVCKWKDTHDLGRYQVTGADRDRMYFKVPTLRNIAKTGPYFHDGSISSLDQAVRLMAKYECGVKLDQRKVALIVDFLGSLTGELPQEYIAKPVLPPMAASNSPDSGTKSSARKEASQK